MNAKIKAALAQINKTEHQLASGDIATVRRILPILNPSLNCECATITGCRALAVWQDKGSHRLLHGVYAPIVFESAIALMQVELIPWRDTEGFLVWLEGLR